MGGLNKGIKVRARTFYKYKVDRVDKCCYDYF